MFKSLDFVGTKRFDEILEKLFEGLRHERVFENGVPHMRIYFPNKGVPSEARDNGAPVSKRSKDVVTPVKREPKSILEMLKDGDARLEKLLGDIIDQKLDERRVAAVPTSHDVDESMAEVEFDEYEADEEGDEVPEDVGSAIDQPSRRNPSVFIANRLTFLVQTMFPIVFDTSTMATDSNALTVAIDEDKTFPRINDIDELGFIASEINRSDAIQKEIGEYLDDTEFSNIYCFPYTICDKRRERPVMALRFVVYPRKG